MTEYHQTSWHSYPKIWNVGHPSLEEFWKGNILVEEKVDGSQFSFGIFNGELKIRSKGVEMYADNPEKMFSKAVEQVKLRHSTLYEGWTYRAEYLSKPKHNSLAYDRVPKNNLIIFDINDGYETYLSPLDKRNEAERLDFECVPILHTGKIDSPEEVKSLLEASSVLGGQKVEGLVFKDYTKFGKDGKCLMAKYVSEAFREKHGKEWKKANPSSVDIVSSIGQSLRSESRWNKAIQHLREKGTLENSPRDIGNLMKEIQRDVMEECKEEIADKLSQWAVPKIRRIVAAGFPEWYKEKLLKESF